MEEKLIQARIPKKLYIEIQSRVKSGYYGNKSEVVREALRKMFAEQRREYLRELARKKGATEREMLKELEKIRHES